jgi:hypothetical protein
MPPRAARAAAIATPLDVDLASAEVFRVGRCTMHTVAFTDVGLVWCAPPRRRFRRRARRRRL